MKAVLISIPPKGCAKIANGEKTIEVRKTCPAIKTPFKCYIYCTNGKKTLIDITKDGEEDYWGNIYHGKPIITSIYMPSYLCASTEDCRRKVIGEFVCDKIDIYSYGEISSNEYWIIGLKLKQTCLTYEELKDYGKGKTLYGLHISELKIYEKPKELGEFFHSRKYTTLQSFITHNSDRVTRPPQSWCYVEQLEEEK